MFTTVGTFIGGLGLFLLAVSMITDGLRVAAGDALRNILATWTNTRVRGVASGVLVTGVVQSSSAVTVATIGFVNAGLLTLAQSLGVVYGANVGTTVTGWIVAIVGFGFKVELFALPLIGLGMLARLLRGGTRLASVGEAVAGFGLFFIGIDFLKDAFEGLSASVDVAGFAPQGGVGIVLYVGLGFLMTVVTQSSSAAIALTLTAATGGLLGLNAAAAMVIGANVGTTSTAAFAVIGATANARRVAAAHVAFNLLTGAVALLLLPVMLWLVRTTGGVLGLDDVPAVSLALFHTVFNLLGLALMWPLTDRLAAFLAQRFTTRAELLSMPKYLDQNVLQTPALAVDALVLELDRLGEIVRSALAANVSTEGGVQRDTAEQLEAARSLVDAIEGFVTRMELSRLPEELRGSLPIVLRISGYFDDVLGLAHDLQAHRADMAAVQGKPAGVVVAEFEVALLAHLERCDARRADFAVADLEESYDDLRARWRSLKDTLLAAAADQTLPVTHLSSGIEGVRTCLRMAEQLTKAAVRLHALTPERAAPAPKDPDDDAAELQERVG